MREFNFILQTDSYKLSHHRQYPPGTKHVFSYLESRDGMFDATTFFGLQYYLDKYLTGRVFTSADIEDAISFASSHFGNRDIFNADGWSSLYRKHNGRLPLRIKAVPEGMTISNSNVLMTIENTDEDFPWLTNFVETLLLKVWYSTTVCTLSREIKKLILSYLKATGDVNLIDFKLHDFGYRGVSSEESAAIGGAAHLVNFKGTDTIAAILMAERYYDAYEMPAFSIPASEHSTITSWGKENERQAYENMLTSYPEGLVACVSDSYDIFNACDSIWGDALKEHVLSRSGTLVVRPDSGDPVIVVPKVLDILGERFDFTTNDKGYRVLHPNVRVIQGDGVNYQSIDMILAQMRFKGWSADNVAFGMGGALLQQVNRDTQSFAIKASHVCGEYGERDVFKEATGKESKRGKLSLYRRNYESDSYFTANLMSEDEQRGHGCEEILETVFENGEMKRRQTLDEVRYYAKV